MASHKKRSTPFNSARVAGEANTARDRAGKVIDTSDARVFNRPTENLPPFRLCNICGFPLQSETAEYRIGIHVWCLQERRIVEHRRIPGPSYGKLSTGTDD
jgi:hypothetical protein